MNKEQPMTSQPLVRTTYEDQFNTPRDGSTGRGESRVDMEQYYQYLEQIHGSGLHSWGIATGLAVSVVTSPAGLQITPGIGLDANGKHISLAAGGKAEINSPPVGTVTSLATVTATGVTFPTPANSGGANSGSDQYLTIEWRETFDDATWNSSGGQIFQKLHTPWIRLQPLSTFPTPTSVTGQQLILGRVSLDASGNVTNLTPEYRRMTGLPVGSIQLQKVTATSAPPLALDSGEAGSIHPLPTGGLDLTVSSSTDEIHLECNDGIHPNFAKVSLGAEKIVARKEDGTTESVVIDTEAGSLTASGPITTSGNMVANGTITAGKSGTNGEVIVNDAQGNSTIVLNGGIATVEIGNADSAGVLHILNTSGQAACSLDGSGKGRFASINSTASSGWTIAVLAQNGGNTALLGTPSFAGQFQGNVSIEGNVGIGTTSPNNQLVNTAQASFGGNTSNTGSEPIEVQGPGAGVSFYDRTGGAAGRWVIYSDQTGGAGTETLRFWSSNDKASITQDGTLSCTSMEASNDAGFAIGITSYGRFIGVNSRGTFGIQATNFNNQNSALLSTPSQAGWFDGDVDIVGNISKSGGSFRIDHPLEPANKYLSHSLVESPDMKNIYDGVAVLDANGEAEIELPAWFEALNRDFRYQLTCIGGYAPVYIAEKVHDNRFKIAGGQPGLEVSWLVTGIRQDAWAKAHPIPVEEDKSPDEQGYYLHPELHGASEERDIRLVLFPAEITQKM
jgi:hypothetical protein